MSRSDTMAQLLRLARLAERSERTGESAPEAIGNQDLHDESRRRLMQGVLVGGATAAAAAVAPQALAAAARLSRETYSRLARTRGVAIVGAGQAGLSCALELARNGVAATAYEASPRVGGRCWSLRGYFPNQVAERGAEFIGASHHTMLGYARMFNLPLEEFSRYPGQSYYHFQGSAYTEAQVAAEFGDFTACIRDDLGKLNFPTADRHAGTDDTFDFMSVDDYLQMYGASGMLRGVIASAYAAEFGAGLDELSAISFLRYVYGDRRSKFAAHGRHSNGQFHVVDGNDRIASAIAQRLPVPVQLGHRLVAVHRLAGGRVRLTFDAGGRHIQREHDVVVLALPFSVLRDVHLDASLELPQWKQQAIASATMGDNSKLMVGFTQPYWYTKHAADGSGSSDRAFLQNTWESNPIKGGRDRAVLTHHAGGALARAMNPLTVQADARAFLGDLEQALPGANAMVRRNRGGEVVAFTQNWSLNPWSKGSYSYPRPGYFTTIAHNEAKPVGNVLFAGEHTSSFYEWQGFLEGAALSGLRAANEACNLMVGR